jgi:hypothetical protein
MVSVAVLREMSCVELYVVHYTFYLKGPIITILFQSKDDILPSGSLE